MQAMMPIALYWLEQAPIPRLSMYPNWGTFHFVSQMCYMVSALVSGCGFQQEASLAKAEPRTAMIRARTQPALKAEAEATFEKLGLSPSTAINLFYRQVVEHRGLPFEVKLPNAPTRRAMRDAQSGRNLTGGEAVDDLISKLDATAK